MRFALFTLILASAAFGSIDAPRFDDLATAVVADLQATVTATRADQAELRKINKDFGMAYRLKSVTMHFKRPGKLRMEGRIGQESALYIVNGSTRYYSIPKFNIKSRDDLGSSPGKRYSLLELGIISRGDDSGVQARYLRPEPVDGASCHVFDLIYKGDDSLRYALWIDPLTRVIRKREWYDSAGKLRATFLHLNPKEISPGVWMPTRLEIRNGEGVLAATLEYTDIKVNQNLDDALFSTT